MNSVAIIGGGITGLTAAFYLQRNRVPVTVYESSSRPGGVIQSCRRDGYLAESVGSITLNQSGAAIGALAILGSMAYQRGAASTLSPLIAPPPPGQSASPAVRSPSPKPKPTP